MIYLYANMIDQETALKIKVNNSDEIVGAYKSLDYGATWDEISVTEEIVQNNESSLRTSSLDKTSFLLLYSGKQIKINNGYLCIKSLDNITFIPDEKDDKYIYSVKFSNIEFSVIDDTNIGISIIADINTVEEVAEKLGKNIATSKLSK